MVFSTDMCYPPYMILFAQNRSWLLGGFLFLVFIIPTVDHRKRFFLVLFATILNRGTSSTKEHGDRTLLILNLQGTSNSQTGHSFQKRQITRLQVFLGETVTCIRCDCVNQLCLASIAGFQPQLV